MTHMSSRPTMIDLFAGCGGMTVGFEREGFRSVLAVEWDRAAASTYAANFGEKHTFWGDIANLREEDIPEVDIVIGGPPCQGFSNLGSKDVNDPRNKLWKEYLRVVDTAKPKIFVLENVERFKRSSEFQLLLDEADHGIIKDYELSYGVLLAADFGVAQRRPRTIVIGSRIGKVELPAPTHSKTGDGDTKQWETVRSRIAGLDETPATTELPDTYSEFFGERIRGVFKGRDLHFGRQPRQLSLDRYDHVPPGRRAFRSTRPPLAAMLAREADRDHGRHGSDAVGSSLAHHPDRVLQAGEGRLPASAVGTRRPAASRQPGDHPLRGLAASGLPQGLRLVRHQDGDRQADRQRSSLRTRGSDRPAHPPAPRGVSQARGRRGLTRTADPTAAAIADATAAGSSCSQNRRTVHPRSARCWLVSASLRAFASSLVAHHAPFADGLVAWSGQRCQKHPSMNTAILRPVKAMSMVRRLRPGTGYVTR